MCKISVPTLNIIAYVSHLVNALTILGLTLGGVVIEDRDVYNTTYQYTTWNNGTLAQEYVDDAYQLRISTLMFVFSALSFAFQLFASIKTPRYDWKGGVVEKHEPHPLRFIEYAISAPVMFVAISLLSGIRNAHLIAALAVLVCVTMGCGLVAEFALDRAVDGDDEMYMVAWVAHLFGWVGVSTAYGILFATTNIVVHSDVSEEPPAFVWAIIIFQFLAFMSFGFVQFAQLIVRRRVEWSEKAYIVLSLAAKTQLTWNVFFSVLVDV